MEPIIRYISSQIIYIISNIFSGSTFHAKRRKRVLVLNSIAQVGFMLSYMLLKAWSGVASSVVSLIRNLLFMTTLNKEPNRKEINKTDIFILVTIYVLIMILSIFTYKDIFSLLPLIATMLYTYSVCQKNVKTYKILGIPMQILWLIYAISIMSISAIVIEATMLVNCIWAFYKLRKKKTIKQKRSKNEDIICNNQSSKS